MNPVAPASPPLSALMSALHASRRRDAARIIQRYRHLVADGELSAPLAVTKASACAGPATNHGGIPMFPKLNANFLMVLVLLGFGIAHVFGIAMLQRATIVHEQHAALLAQGD